MQKLNFKCLSIGLSIMFFSVISQAQLTTGAGGAAAVGPNIIGNGSARVGIGNANPWAPLSFSNSNAIKKISLSDVDPALFGNPNGTGSLTNHFFYGFGTEPFVLRYQVSSSASHVFCAATSGSTSNELMRITHLGSVGIGTNSPQARLHVTGGKVLIGDAGTSQPAGYRLYVQEGILTEKLKCAVRNSTNWADYVFNENYNLKPLSEVETFIKQNKHLPDVPSADELVKEGLDVGDMQAKQMMKIEELTLYIIQMQKEIESLKIENAKLNNTVSSLNTK